MGELTVNYRESRFSTEDWNIRGGDVATGDRAPDANLLALSHSVGTGNDEPVRLFEVFKDIRFVALLLTGANPNESEIRSIRRIARELREDYGALVEPRFIAAHALKSSIQELSMLTNEETPVLLDHEMQAHTRYETSVGASLYLIRPDGYIAYRSIPANVEGVIAYLRNVVGAKEVAERRY